MKIAVLIINIAAVVVIIALVITLSVQSHILPEQEANTRWYEVSPTGFSDIFKKDDTMGIVHYAQVSVFYQSGVSLDKIYQMTYDLETATENYVSTIRGDAVADSYCTAPTSLKFSSKTDIMTKSATLESYFVGGDFLLFHPYEILSGTFLSDDTIMHDNAVIDENAAWELFGSNNVVGKYIFFNDTAINICGVVRIPNADKGYIFLDNELSQALTGLPAMFNCVEFVLPSPVSGDGLAKVKEKLGISEGNVSVDKTIRVVENSSRTSLPALFDILGNVAELSLRDDAIILPAWENRARERDIRMAIVLFFLCVAAVIPVTTGIVYLIKLYKFIMKKFIISKRKKGEN
ncbi:MAG: ABC transporter permease [Ruminococcus sp.]|jgi:hypothetical protein|nr:ABC transporter permease [Ruminococcus sp.]